MIDFGPNKCKNYANNYLTMQHMKVTRGVSPDNRDERGFISKLLPEGAVIRDIMYITSRAGSVRSNHYHKTDTHYCFLVSGKAEWYEKPVEGGVLEKEVLNPGDMVYTEAMIIHAVKFLEDSVLLAFSTLPRENQAAYENDTVRVELIKADSGH